eukprot:1904995-Heterocapsa_arctica.AAC.1
MSALSLRTGAAGGATGAFVVAVLQALGHHYPGFPVVPAGVPTVQCIHQAPCHCEVPEYLFHPPVVEITTATSSTRIPIDAPFHVVLNM